MSLKRLILMVFLSVPVLGMDCPGLFDPILGPGGGTAVIDGSLTSSATEWDEATTYPITLTFQSPVGTINGTLYMMNDVKNLYVAVEIPDVLDNFSPEITLDQDNDDVADDAFSYTTGTSTAGDWFYAPNSMADVDDGGSVNVEAAHATSGGVLVVEMSHPLDSFDDHDWEIELGETFQFRFGYFGLPFGFGNSPFMSHTLASLSL